MRNTKLIFCGLIIVVPAYAMKHENLFVEQAITNNMMIVAKEWCLNQVKALLSAKSLSTSLSNSRPALNANQLVCLKDIHDTAQATSAQSPLPIQTQQRVTQQEVDLLARFSSMSRPDLANYIGETKDTRELELFCKKSALDDLYFVSMRNRTLLEREDVQMRIINGPIKDFQDFLLDPRNRSLVGPFINTLSHEKFHEIINGCGSLLIMAEVYTRLMKEGPETIRHFVKDPANLHYLDAYLHIPLMREILTEQADEQLKAWVKLCFAGRHSAFEPDFPPDITMEQIAPANRAAERNTGAYIAEETLAEKLLKAQKASIQARAEGAHEKARKNTDTVRAQIVNGPMQQRAEGSRDKARKNIENIQSRILNGTMQQRSRGHTL